MVALVCVKNLPTSHQVSPEATEGPRITSYHPEGVSNACHPRRGIENRQNGYRRRPTRATRSRIALATSPPFNDWCFRVQSVLP